MIQALSGFVALRDMVRHAESQFHLRQLTEFWNRDVPTTSRHTYLTSHLTDSEADNKKWCHFLY